MKSLGKARSVMWVGLAVAGGLLVAGLALGGPLGTLATAGLEAAPFLLLGWLAHLGRTRPTARVLSWVGGSLVVGGVALAVAGASAVAWEHHPDRLLPVLACVVVGVTVAGLSTSRLGTPFAARLGLDPRDPVHRLALFLCLGLTLLCLAPLVGSGGQALVLQLLTRDDFDLEMSALDYLLPLAWIGPGAFVLVGFGLHRDLGATLDRLGLRWPGWGGVGRGAGVGLALVPMALAVGYGLENLFEFAEIPVAPEEEVEAMFGLGSMTLLTGLALAVSAGVGEELAVRGVLQPRLGLVLANLLFASLHALQYTADGVVVVFLLGVAFGLLRRRTNTLVSMVGHAVYDFALIGLIIAGRG